MVWPLGSGLVDQHKVARLTGQNEIKWKSMAKGQGQGQGFVHYLMHHCVGHTAWAPEGQGGSKSRKLEKLQVIL